MADYSEAFLIPTYGMYALPYANVYPDLATQLTQLYQERTAQIDWLPAGWLDGVLSLHNQNGEVLVPAPGTVSPPIPWLYTSDQVNWWTDFNQRANAIIQAYAADQSAQGAQLLAALYADSAFWDTAYNIATFLATPVTVAQNVASAVASVAATAAGVARTLTSSTGAVVALGAAGLAAWWFLRKKR